MGSISSSFADAYHINVVNPASYSFLRATSFEVGLESKFSSFRDPNIIENTGSARLSYFALAFPLKNPINNLFEREKRDFEIAMAFSLLPVSTVAYNIVLLEEDENLGEVFNIFSGTGGTYKAQWGGSFKYKSLSIGTNLGLLFGKITTERITDFTENRAAFDNFFVSDYSIRGFDYKLGLIYQLILNQTQFEESKGTNLKAINFGFTAKSTTSFNTTEEVFFRAQNNQDLFGGRIDTLRNETRTAANGKMPSEYSFGITYLSGANFALGFDYGRTNWSKYFNPADPETLNNTNRYSIGGYYRPNPSSITSFFSRIYYRFGLYYREDPRFIESQDLNTYGISLGVGLPLAFQRKISHLNIGFEYGSRGAVEVLRERFFKISLGFTFNDDEWFIKRKFN